MNNKQLGTDFERRMCVNFALDGYWVHFLTPDARGAQPFDIIAVKNGRAYAIECKTLSPRVKSFNISRLEDNQIMAFERWIACGNAEPMILVEWGKVVVLIGYEELKRKKKIDMQEAVNAGNCWE